MRYVRNQMELMRQQGVNVASDVSINPLDQVPVAQIITPQNEESVVSAVAVYKDVRPNHHMALGKIPFIPHLKKRLEALRAEYHQALLTSIETAYHRQVHVTVLEVAHQYATGQCTRVAFDQAVKVYHEKTAKGRDRFTPEVSQLLEIVSALKVHRVNTSLAPIGYTGESGSLLARNVSAVALPVESAASKVRRQSQRFFQTVRSRGQRALTRQDDIERALYQEVTPNSPRST